MSSAEAEILNLVNSWSRAFEAKNVDGMLANYAPDVVFFDLKPPSTLSGLPAVRSMWEACMPFFPESFTVEHTEQNVTVSGDLAFFSGVNHVVPKETSDPNVHEMHVRVTVCFRKIDGQWKVVHEHSSIPINPVTQKAEFTAARPAKKQKVEPSPNALKATTPTDTTLLVTRNFDAPRDKVFDATVQPEMVRKWVLGPPGWTMPVCELDARPGGRFKYEWVKPDGTEEKGMCMRGEFLEVDRDKGREVHTELFDEDWTGGRTTVTSEHKVIDETHSRLEMTIEYSSKEARDAAMKIGMLDGMEDSYRRLDELLSNKP